MSGYGEQAFPVATSPGGRHERGMTLRDYFAGQALVGKVVGGEYGSWEGLAGTCYGIADAMLAERDGGLVEEPNP